MGGGLQQFPPQARGRFGTGERLVAVVVPKRDERQHLSDRAHEPASIACTTSVAVVNDWLFLGACARGVATGACEGRPAGRRRAAASRGRARRRCARRSLRPRPPGAARPPPAGPQPRWARCSPAGPTRRTRVRRQTMPLPWHLQTETPPRTAALGSRQRRPRARPAASRHCHRTSREGVAIGGARQRVAR